MWWAIELEFQRPPGVNFGNRECNNTTIMPTADTLDLGRRIRHPSV